MVKTIKDVQKIKDTTLQSFGNRIGNDDNRIYIMTSPPPSLLPLCVSSLRQRRAA